MNGENFIEKQLHKINKKFKEARDKFKVKFKDGRTKRYAPKSQKEEDKVITGAMMLGADWDIIKPGSSEYNKKEKANYSNITWKEKLENLKEANWSVLAQKDDSGRVLKDLNVHFQAKDDKEAEEIVKINFPKSKIIKINKDLHKVIIKESFKEQSRTCFNCGKLTSELMYRWYHGDQDDLVCADCAKKLKHSDTNLSGKSVYDVNNKESFKEKLKNLKENLNFNKWFDTFLDEKNLQHKSWTIKDKNGTDNFINSEFVIESIKNSPSNEQKSIKDMLIKIDFKNGNVMDYFKHLATGLINLKLGESFKEKLRLEDIGEYRYNNFDKILKLFKKMQAYYAKHDSGFYELPFDNWSVTNAETNKNKMSKSDFEDIVLMVESHFNFKIKK